MAARLGRLVGGSVFTLSLLWFRSGERRMKHDIEDLVEMIKMIEDRLILIERRLESLRDHRQDESSWYWLFG